MDPTCWFIPQTPTRARAGPGRNQGRELNLSFPYRVTLAITCCSLGCMLARIGSTAITQTQALQHGMWGSKHPHQDWFWSWIKALESVPGVMRNMWQGTEPAPGPALVDVLGQWQWLGLRTPSTLPSKSTGMFRKSAHSTSSFNRWKKQGNRGTRQPPQSLEQTENFRPWDVYHTHHALPQVQLETAVSCEAAGHTTLLPQG